MTLSEIASVSGKGGLFKVVAPTKSGVILESLDEKKTKLIATTHHRVSLLHEISIYTTTEEGTIPLAEVLKKMYAEYSNDLGIDPNSDSSELKAFLKSILPEYDEDRVYVSDIKKLVKWYGVLLQYVPSILTGSDEAPQGASEEAVSEAPSTEQEKESDSTPTEPVAEKESEKK